MIVTGVNLAERGGFAGDPTRLPILGLGHDEVARRYRGFDRDAWGERDVETDYDFLPESGLGNLREFDRIRQILENDFGENSDLIYLGGLDRPPGLPDDFVFVGYDYGEFDTIDNYFSIIYNEIIYGFYPDLRKFGSLLNENLLLSKAEDGEPMRTTHLFLEKGGCDVEELDECYAMGIWLYVRQ